MQGLTPKREWRRGFWCLMVTQFQGAFSDQVLKQLVIFLVLAMNLPDGKVESLVSMAGMLFAVPFILITMLGGWLADRFSKRRVMMSVKTAEVGIMLFATCALASQKLPLQMAAICLMGVHSAVFGPSKYGILPEVLPDEKLSWGNGILEMLTFFAVILGMLVAGYLAEAFAHDQAHSGLVLVGLALVGLTASFGITKVPAAVPGLRLEPNFAVEFYRQMREMKGDRDLWRANWGNSAFFFVATLVQMNLVLYAKLIYHLGPRDNAGLLAALCLGIGAGSALAGVLSRGRIEYGLIPLGAVLLTLAAAVLGWPGIARGWFAVTLTVLGIGGGLFIVPLAAVLQHRPAPEKKGAVQGTAGLLSWIAIALASEMQALLGGTFHCSPPEVFWFCSISSAAAGGYVVLSRPRALPDMLARWCGRGGGSGDAH
jgi:acyl-[acyl-carrier-protein]-phospholipid O-acyltransferase/long-chain-fatty-acid--[acyl-carrier-protein] ligase